MNRRLILPVVATLVAAALLIVVSNSASAKPTYSQSCANCHIADPSISASVSATANDGAATTYSFSISGPYSGATGYAVFDNGGTKITSGYASHGSFKLANWATYTFYAVNKNRGSMHGYFAKTLSPASPPQNTASPTPTTTPTPSIIQGGDQDKSEADQPENHGADKGRNDAAELKAQLHASYQALVAGDGQKLGLKKQLGREDKGRDKEAEGKQHGQSRGRLENEGKGLSERQEH